MKWPPWEKKIVSSDANSRKGVGDFLSQVAAAEETNSQFNNTNAKNLAKVRGLLSQAKEMRFGSFQHCREGNEVLVNCEHKKANLVENIAKSTKNSPTDRKILAEIGMVSEINPNLARTHQQEIQTGFKNWKEQQTIKDDPVLDAEKTQSSSMGLRSSSS